MAGGTGGRLTREGMCVYLELLLYAEQKLTQHHKAIIPQLKNIKLKKEKNTTRGTALVVWWLRICLAMQGTRVQSLVGEDPTCRGVTKPSGCN